VRYEVPRRIGEEPFRTQFPFVMQLLEHFLGAREQVRAPLLFELIWMCQNSSPKGLFSMVTNGTGESGKIHPFICQEQSNTDAK